MLQVRARSIFALVGLAALFASGCGTASLTKLVKGGLSNLSVPTDLQSAHLDLEKSLRSLASAAVESKQRQVKLGDLGVDMARFEGQASLDFLADAKDEKSGEPIEFTYLEIGASEYDALIKEVVVTKALVYQTVTTLNRLAQLSTEILRRPVLINEALRDAVASAVLKTKGKRKPQATELVELRKLAKACAFLMPKFRARATLLAKRISNVSKRIRDPKTAVVMVTHADAVVTNLKLSLNALEETTKWSASALPYILTFGRAHGGQNPLLDFNSGRLDRAELASLLYDPPED